MFLVRRWTVVLLLLSPALGMVEQERLALREDARAMFYHAYDNYMEHAFPVSRIFNPLLKSASVTV